MEQPFAENNKDFVARGYRRFGVAIYAITAVVAVELFAPDAMGWPGCAGIGAVTLGYYNTKYAEVVAPLVQGIMHKYFGGKADG